MACLCRRILGWRRCHDADCDSGETEMENKSLPQNWDRHFDDESGSYFYYNISTGETQWDVPLDCNSEMDASSTNPLINKDPADMTMLENEPAQIPELDTFDERVKRNADYVGMDNEYLDERVKRNVDYVGMANEYKNTSSYRKLDGNQTCLVCYKGKSSHVLFPCGHKCVCTACMKSNRLADSVPKKNARGDKWRLCPLCCEEIKRILPHDGFEYEKYWDWVNEVKPPLPKGFVLNKKIEKKQSLEAFKTNSSSPQKSNLADGESRRTKKKKRRKNKRSKSAKTEEKGIAAAFARFIFMKHS